ncbi:hypothetical protein [Flyfo podovirus Tbat2_2]|nr:hypothetical protein [Flyfo podovirus Tbat2_2]
MKTITYYGNRRMKIITYRGEQYEVEDWVNFVAMDADGDIYAYENKPERNTINWTFRGTACLIGTEPVDWEGSLEKV